MTLGKRRVAVQRVVSSPIAGGNSRSLSHPLTTHSPTPAPHPQVAAEAASFGAALLLDLWTGRLQANEQQRAEQLRGVIERLGPA